MSILSENCIHIVVDVAVVNDFPEHYLPPTRFTFTIFPDRFRYKFSNLDWNWIKSRVLLSKINLVNPKKLFFFSSRWRKANAESMRIARIPFVFVVTYFTQQKPLFYLFSLILSLIFQHKIISCHLIQEKSTREKKVQYNGLHCGSFNTRIIKHIVLDNREFCCSIKNWKRKRHKETQTPSKQWGEKGREREKAEEFAIPPELCSYHSESTMKCWFECDRSTISLRMPQYLASHKSIYVFDRVDDTEKRILSARNDSIKRHERNMNWIASTSNILLE